MQIFNLFFLCIRNKIEHTRRPTFKNPNLESKNELKNTIPHEKINRCLTDISRYLTDTENQFYKISVVSVKYWLYRLNIGLLRFLP